MNSSKARPLPSRFPVVPDGICPPHYPSSKQLKPFAITILLESIKTQSKPSTLKASCPTAVTEVAKACHILDAQVEDLERWIQSVQKVVSMNSILRTRIVYHQSKFLQIVTTEEHTTEYLTGDVEQFLSDEKAFEMNLGTPLFRTAVIGRRFVATIHHAVMDYWSLNPFLRGDAAMLYLGQEPIDRAAFKDFVSLCAGIDRAKADSFWAAHFRGSASTYPPMPASVIARPSEKLEKTLTLNLMSRGIAESHIAWYAEAASEIGLDGYPVQYIQSSPYPGTPVSISTISSQYPISNGYLVDFD